MKKFIKTYGIYNLLEWHGTITQGSISMKVSFTNGTTTAYGVSPATFTTKDEVTQYVIEHSKQFKSGRIKLISSRPLPSSSEEVKKPAQPAAQPETKKEGGVKELEFAVVEDAKDYIADKFGVSRSKLRTKAECEAAAEANGVKINWKA